MITYSIAGKGKGKLGSSVYYINHGTQVAREYTGSVTNPSTSAQVAQRARFKLASQVSAAMEDVIVIPRKGMQSPRNRFTKVNMPFFYADGQGAVVSYENLQITIGNQGLPGILVERIANNKMTLALQSAANHSVTHVVYSIFKKTDEDMLQLMNSVVVEGSSDNDAFTIDVDDIPGNLVVYAYGFRGRNAKAEAKYGNYQVASGADVARLFANRQLEMNNYRFTSTRGTSIGAADTENITPDAQHALLYITNIGSGDTVIVVGSDNPIHLSDGVVQVPLGAVVQITATPQSGWSFNGFFNNGEQFAFANSSPITFTMNGMRDIIVNYVADGGLE